MSRYEKCCRYIENILAEYPTAPYPTMTEASARSAIELAYTLGDIGDSLYNQYNAELREMTEVTK